MDTSRMTGFQIQQHQNKVRLKQNQLSKEQFEEDLRQSVSRTTNSGTSLFGDNRNIFETALNKDVKKSLSLMERKRKMQIDMAAMINDLNDEDFTRFEGTMIEFNLTK